MSSTERESSIGLDFRGENACVIAFIVLGILAGHLNADQSVAHFTIDATADVHPISRFIYGINQPIGPNWSGATLTRLGGNRWTAYNWTSNASNAGNDYHYQNDGFLKGGDDPAGAMIPGPSNAHDHDAGIILTVPMAGYVSADKKADGDVHNSGPDYLNTRFHREIAAKNATFTLTPDPNGRVVFEDEMVNFVATKFPWGFENGDTPVWFMLDNEPDIWQSTHAEVHADHPTYAEIVGKTIEYSNAIKHVAPQTLIFGPANYGWNGFVSFQHAPDADGRDFQEFYLGQLATAERENGHRLLDVLDVHWYPEVRADGVRITDPGTRPSVAAARIQAPRSLWDPTFTEPSWIAQNIQEPIRLIPRLLDKIARCYPGTKLSISEYNYGGGNDISGAIAEADVLGILGREGVFSANEWPLGRRELFTAAGFRAFRDFDGKGAGFGDTSVHADTDHVEDTSVYASLDSKSSQLIAIAINKTDHAISALISIAHAGPLSHADIFQLTAADPALHASGNIPLQQGNTATVDLPPLSVTTLRFSSP